MASFKPKHQAEFQGDLRLPLAVLFGCFIGNVLAYVSVVGSLPAFEFSLNLYPYITFFPSAQVSFTFFFIFILGLFYQVSPFNHYNSFRPASALRSFGFFLCIPTCFNLFYTNTSHLMVFSMLIFAFLSFFYFFILYENAPFSSLTFESILLLLLACLGSMFIMLANDLFTFYLSLELQTLPIYVLVYYTSRRQLLSSERSMKYFLLGSISSGITLFGVTLFYGLFGSTSFKVIYYVSLSSSDIGLQYQMTLPIGLVLGGIFFKVLVFPFHVWSPDVYQGSSYSLLFFIAVLSKLPMFNFFWGFFYFIPFSNLFYFFSFFTLFFGTFGAIFQSSAKRFLAYASMSHTAFLVRCFPSFSIEGFLFYLIFYVFTTFGVITVLFSLTRWKTNSELELLEQLRWSFSSRPVTMFFFSILFLSLAGVPPFSGFFAKFFVIRSIALDSFWVLSFFFLFFSLFSLYYYLAVISRSQLGFVKYSTLFRPLTYSSSLVLSFTIFFTIFFPFFFAELFWFVTLV